MDLLSLKIEQIRLIARIFWQALEGNVYRRFVAIGYSLAIFTSNSAS